MPPCHPLRAEHANQNRGADWDERAVLSPLRSEGSYLRRAGWRTGKGGVVSAELVQDVLNLALANGLAEDFEDSANRALPLLVAEGNDAGDASHELARWKSLRPPIVFQAGPDRLWQLRGEVVGFSWVDTRAQVEERCTHHALRDGFVEAAELGYALDECRCIHCVPPAKCRDFERDLTGGRFRSLRQDPVGPHEVTRIAVGIPLEVVLMLRLGFPERTCRRHFGHELSRPPARSVYVSDRFLGNAALFVVEVEDGGAIALSNVVALAV